MPEKNRIDRKKSGRDAIIRKTRDDYNRIAPAFSDTRTTAWPEMNRFKPLVRDGYNILDWGCGNGRLLLVLEGKSTIYLGLDQSIKLIEIARKRFRELVEKKQASFVCTAENDFPLPVSGFDLVFMIASLHHLPDPGSRREILMDIYRTTKPGGRLIITVWNLFSRWAEKKIDRHAWKQISEDEFLIPWKAHDQTVLCERYYYRFSVEELRELVENTGFSIETLEFAGADNCPYSIKDGRNLSMVAVKPKS